ncbi:uncharacterized protein LOC112453371 [Temnothorax curvispinosus]|uniref:Uncharacterized protein LOC112453371 n=1 Tax=Temnothorax curvispinosus TaxID=300111 RepID=A0A6J1PJQ6_9HYME|nr:uncharacterized protein LOC112453371 [Temnothorax curvispinosus]
MSLPVWTEKDTFELIRLYKENAPLWDMKLEDYKNKELKARLISDIATRMNIAPEEINKKLQMLRSQVSREINKLKLKKKNADSEDKIYVSAWSYFSALNFLIPTVTSRSKRSEVMIQGTLEKKGRSKVKAESNKIENKETLKRKQENGKGQKRSFKSLDVVNKEKSKRLCVSPITRNKDERFGEWVALELQSLHSEVNKRVLKSEIRKAICHIADLDNADIVVPSTSLNSSQSSTYTPMCEITNIKSENVYNNTCQ